MKQDVDHLILAPELRERLNNLRDEVGILPVDLTIFGDRFLNVLRRRFEACPDEGRLLGL